MRFSPFARFRLKRVPAHSPYAGSMKWHHYAGLLFGVITLTWTYSGLLSMGPFNWFEPVGGRGAGQRRGARSDRSSLDTLSIEQVREAQRVFSQSFVPKSLELVDFQRDVLGGGAGALAVRSGSLEKSKPHSASVAPATRMAIPIGREP